MPMGKIRDAEDHLLDEVKSLRCRISDLEKRLDAALLDLRDTRGNMSSISSACHAIGAEVDRYKRALGHMDGTECKCAACQSIK